MHTHVRGALGCHSYICTAFRPFSEVLQVWDDLWWQRGKPRACHLVPPSCTLQCRGEKSIMHTFSTVCGTWGQLVPRTLRRLLRHTWWWRWWMFLIILSSSDVEKKNAVRFVTHLRFLRHPLFYCIFRILREFLTSYNCPKLTVTGIKVVEISTIRQFMQAGYHLYNTLQADVQHSINSVDFQIVLPSFSLQTFSNQSISNKRKAALKRKCLDSINQISIKKKVASLWPNTLVVSALAYQDSGPVWLPNRYTAQKYAPV